MYPDVNGALAKRPTLQADGCIIVTQNNKDMISYFWHNLIWTMLYKKVSDALMPDEIQMTIHINQPHNAADQLCSRSLQTIHYKITFVL